MLLYCAEWSKEVLERMWGGFRKSTSLKNCIRQLHKDRPLQENTQLLETFKQKSPDLLEEATCECDVSFVSTWHIMGWPDIGKHYSWISLWRCFWKRSASDSGKETILTILTPFGQAPSKPWWALGVKGQSKGHSRSLSWAGTSVLPCPWTLVLWLLDLNLGLFYWNSSYYYWTVACPFSACRWRMVSLVDLHMS